MWLDELISVLVADGVGTYGTNIFMSTKAAIPSGVGPYLSLIETGGSGPDRTQNRVLRPAYQRPAAQIVARAASYPAARLMAQAAYNSLVKIRNQVILGVAYREVRPLQEPNDLLGLDAQGRATVVFNVIGDKRPS